MAELAVAMDSKSIALTGVWVRVPPPAQTTRERLHLPRHFGARPELLGRPSSRRLFDGYVSKERETKVAEAYVLIEAEIGKPSRVAGELAQIPGVSVVHVLTGPYDLIIRIEADDVDGLGKLVLNKVQAVGGISRTLTCPVVQL